MLKAECMTLVEKFQKRNELLNSRQVKISRMAALAEQAVDAELSQLKKEYVDGERLIAAGITESKIKSILGQASCGCEDYPTSFACCGTSYHASATAQEM